MCVFFLRFLASHTSYYITPAGFELTEKLSLVSHWWQSFRFSFLRVEITDMKHHAFICVNSFIFLFLFYLINIFSRIKNKKSWFSHYMIITYLTFS